MVGLLGRVISPLQGLYLHRTTHHRKTRTNIHALSGIRTHDPRNQPAKNHASDRTTVTGIQTLMLMIIDLDVNIQIYCCESNRTTDITMHSVSYYFSMYFNKSPPYRNFLKSLSVLYMIRRSEEIGKVRFKFDVKSELQSTGPN
jgi:hypothetical protein